MLSLKGTGVHKGIAVGKLVFYERQLFMLKNRHKRTHRPRCSVTGRQKSRR